MHNVFIIVSLACARFLLLSGVAVCMQCSAERFEIVEYVIL